MFGPLVLPKEVWVSSGLSLGRPSFQELAFELSDCIDIESSKVLVCALLRPVSMNSEATSRLEQSSTRPSPRVPLSYTFCLWIRGINNVQATKLMQEPSRNLSIRAVLL